MNQELNNKETVDALIKDSWHFALQSLAVWLLALLGIVWVSYVNFSLPFGGLKVFLFLMLIINIYSLVKTSNILVRDAFLLYVAYDLRKFFNEFEREEKQKQKKDQNGDKQ